METAAPRVQGATLSATLGASLIKPKLWANPNASTSTAARKFLFIHAEGGWDPLCVFAPQFDDHTIQMEPDAEPGAGSTIQSLMLALELDPDCGAGDRNR